MRQMRACGLYLYITDITGTGAGGKWACGQGLPVFGQPCACTSEPTSARGRDCVRRSQTLTAAAAVSAGLYLSLLDISGVCIVCDHCLRAVS